MPEHSSCCPRSENKAASDYLHSVPPGPAAPMFHARKISQLIAKSRPSANPGDTSNKSARARAHALAEITPRAIRQGVPRIPRGLRLGPNQIVNSLKMQIRRIGHLSARARKPLRFIRTKASRGIYCSFAYTLRMATMPPRPLRARFLYISPLPISPLVDD